MPEKSEARGEQSRVPPSSVDDGENGENGLAGGGGGMNRLSGPGKLTRLSGDFDCMLRGLAEFGTTEGLVSGETEFSELRLLLSFKSLRGGDNLVGRGLPLFPVEPLGEKNSSSFSSLWSVAASGSSGVIW